MRGPSLQMHICLFVVYCNAKNDGARGEMTYPKENLTYVPVTDVLGGQESGVDGARSSV